MAEEWPGHVLLEMDERRPSYRKLQEEAGCWPVEANTIR